jgi:hypothetical protein
MGRAAPPPMVLFSPRPDAIDLYEMVIEAFKYAIVA